MKQREYMYDNLKYLLIVSVALNHCSEFFQASIPVFCSTYMFIYMFVMPAFIFVSGLFSKSSFRDGAHVRRRVLYFFLLYLLCKIFLSVPSMILHGSWEFHLFTESGIPWFMMCMTFWYAVTYLLRDAPTYPVLAGSILLAALIGYTRLAGDFLCLSKTIVFYPFFWLGYRLDARRLVEYTGRSGRRIAGGVCFLLLFAGTLLAPYRVLDLRPLFTGRGEAYAQMAYPALGALYRLGQYAVSAALVFCVLAITPRRKLPFTVFGSRTLQVYFFHYIPIYLLNLFPVMQILRGMAPDAVCWLFAVAYCVAVTAFLSLKIFTYPFIWLDRICSRWL